MRFGLAFVTYTYSPARVEMCHYVLRSLSRTNMDGLGRPVLRLSYRDSGFPYPDYFEALKQKFDLSYVPDPAEVSSMSYAVDDAMLRTVEEYPDVTHVVLLCDDRIYNPNWLIELSKLIERHPNAKAWSVFRDAYTEYHRIIGGDGTDVLMTMHDSVGCTTREEWISFIGQHGHVEAPDISHANLRPGERWATNRDYMDIHLVGRHYDRGIGEVDRAIDFVGEAGNI